MEMISTLVRTELGSMPKDWRIATAADICERVVDCKNRTPPVVVHGDYAVVRTPNVRNGRFVRDDLRFTDESSFMEWTARATPQAGDVLITREAPLGEVCPVPLDLKVCLGQRMMLYRPDESKVTSAYLLHALMSSAVQKGLQKKIGGSTVGHAKVDDIRFIQLPLPPTTSEQCAIAEALTDADALIDALEQLLTKKRQIKQGAMQELLTGKRRLPGFAGDWTCAPLGEIARIKTGSMNNQDKVEDGEFPFFVRSQSVERIDTYTHDCEAILIPGEGGIGSIFHYFHGRFALHQRVYGITDFSESVLGRFVYFFMRIFFGPHAMENSVKATVDSLRLPTFMTFEVRLPPTVAEQTAIVEVLSDLEVNIAALEERLTNALALKQAMAQALLTGRIRLVEPTA